MKPKLFPIIKGAIKYVPGVKQLNPQKTTRAIDSKYCYSVWIRHLRHWSSVRKDFPKIVAELGPGASLGVAIAALLSGCECVYAFDIIKYWDVNRNLKVFDELIELFLDKPDIPNFGEYTRVRPEVEDYSFPFEIISEDRLCKAITKERLKKIRYEITDLENPQNQYLRCEIPWHVKGILKKDAVDFIYSQAVLEHVENLDSAYYAMKNWLKPGGLMSHTIDLKAHGTSKTWNGHWTFSDLEWKIVKGGKAFLINRQPYSYHINLHNKYGFKILYKSLVQKENNLSKNNIAIKFKNLTDEELTTSGLYILSRKI